MRTIFIGDVHGCLIELQEMVSLLQLTADDRVILLGDLVNKGPYSIETIKYVYRQGFRSIMGNNDYYGIQHKSAWLKAKLTPEEYRWFSRLPFYLKTDQYLAVHAGLHPDYSLEKTPVRTLLTIRKVHLKPWHHFYRGALPIIYGHWAQQGLSILPNNDQPLTIGLDSGCVYGKELSAYIWEERKLVQVKAKTVYQPI